MGKRTLAGRWQGLFLVCAAVGLFLAVNQVFHLRLFGITLVANRYLYLLLGLYLPWSFLLYSGRAEDRNRIPWYDLVLFAAAVLVNGYFVYHAMSIIMFSWEFNPPLPAVVSSVVLWALILEAVRRSNGLLLFGTILVLSLYPLYAPYMPAFLSGQGYTLWETASFHALSTQSILGIPLTIMADVVIGFILFGVVLEKTGGGQFFMDLATAILGRSRGGPAKMAVLGSALMGSISGSVISNVVTTGSITIPLMRRTGYPAQSAAAIEACASTGGVMMPPVMGATAFVMASFLKVPYADVILAALIPSVLYYYSLFLQVDCIAARIGLGGLAKEDMPSARATLKRGWPFVVALGLLLYLIIGVQIETRAPYWVSGVLLLIAAARPWDRIRLSGVVDLIVQTGQILVELVAVIAAVGFIVGSLSITGMAQAMARELIFIAGSNNFLLLLMGAITSFILGMGMTITAVYVFLAVVLAPALVRIGFDPMAAHLFIFYWGMLSFITPPVAMGVFAAASLARTHPMRTGIEAMRLGMMLYVLPFLFVYNPAMILRGEIGWSFPVILTSALLGIWLVSGGLQAYVIGVGRVMGGLWIGLLLRVALVVGGVLLAVPEDFGLSGPSLVFQGANLIGLGISIPTLVACWLLRPRVPALAPGSVAAASE